LALIAFNITSKILFIRDDIAVAFASGLFWRFLEDLVIIYFQIVIISGKHND
jgi:hypothetical protein